MKIANFLFCELFIKINDGIRTKWPREESSEDAPHFSFGSIKFEKFRRSRIQFQLTNFSKKNLQYNSFRNFRNCDFLENQLVLRLRPTLKKTELCYLRNWTFSQS